MIRYAHPLLAMLVVGAAACQRPAARPDVSEAARASCREEVDRVYSAQNRADLSMRDSRDSPFSSNYVTGITSRGLGAQYGRGDAMEACLSNKASRDVGGAAVPPSIGPTFKPY